MLSNRPAPAPAAVYYWHGDTLRSRSLSTTVLHERLNVPPPPARLVADWQRETLLRLALEPGDVEPLPLARARMRWPDYGRCVQAAADWTRALGLADALGKAEVALMACRGARYHHDGVQYGGAAFCNLFLSEDQGLDLHFAATGHRIPLARGTVVVFDTGQPHAVVARGSSRFCADDFAASADVTQVFLTWELALEHAAVAHALAIRFGTDPSTALALDAAQVWPRGGPAEVCPQSGQWLAQD